MLEIIGNFVRYAGSLWTVLQVDDTAVHLVNADGGVCVTVTDPGLLAALAALVSVS